LALALAVEVETLAEMYCHALSIGDPALLGEVEMRAVVDKFAAYNRP
jgi:L-fuculose-phosphate aldolase